ncbi:hypothetical protein [Saccharopolyspora pogona]|uniref:hypothetical protein n=1 Tax=Saccharopolyspora pogona TaxID=333966 RepID=UPI00168649E6|nr:hypothetical protein [Saccharopolyspora pogona]
MQATLNVQQFERMTDGYRGQFDTKGTTWSWGQYEDGELWAECIETDELLDRERLLLESVSGADLRTLFSAVAKLVGAKWADVLITDDYGKTKRVKL